MPDDEWDAITLNYTSGTTGDPKAWSTHHRGAPSLAMGQCHHLPHEAASGCICGRCRCPLQRLVLPVDGVDRRGTHVCLRARARRCDVRRHRHAQGDASVRRADRDATLLNATEAERKPLPHVGRFATAAAPPPEAVLAAMKSAGFTSRMSTA